MNYKRITVSIPQYVYEQLVQYVPSGKRSDFVSSAVQQKVMEDKIMDDPIENFIQTAKKNPLKATNKEILQAIRKGRT